MVNPALAKVRPTTSIIFIHVKEAQVTTTSLYQVRFEQYSYN